eukprot:1536190-Rhodomonas_salina.3
MFRSVSAAGPRLARCSLTLRGPCAATRSNRPRTFWGTRPLSSGERPRCGRSRGQRRPLGIRCAEV